MNKNSDYIINDRWILEKRGSKNSVDWQRPYAWQVEKERAFSGEIVDTATIFLTNLECPYHCLMCDLWKNTTDEPVPVGAIPAQIEWALKQMPPAKQLKLYNSGSFFDEGSIPEEDYQKIASLCKNFETVIIESHAKRINEKCLRFRDMLIPELEVAIGLETVHSEILQKLNKRMTLHDFSNAVEYLNRNSIRSRAFILLRPPFMSEDEGVEWAEKSVDYAFEAGVECCIIIPVRAGNGAMEILQEKGVFNLTEIYSLEKVLEYGIGLNAGRVFADVWDIEMFSKCKKCTAERKQRLNLMNLNQQIINPVMCSCSFYA
jgi:hypothetical protein